MPYSPEDILGLSSEEGGGGDKSLDNLMGQMGLKDPIEQLFFLGNLNALGNDPAYEPSITSWLKNLQQRHRMQDFPGVIQNLLKAKTGGANQY